MNAIMNCRRWTGCIVIPPVLLLLCAVASGQDFTDQQVEFFESKIRPLLIDSCFECHGPESDPPEGGLSLTSRSAIMRGGDSGPALNLENVEESLLIDAVNYGDLFQMPPESKLGAEQIDLLTQWVEMGAPWSAETEHAVAATEVFDLQERRANHWCWQPIQRPDLPNVDALNWPLDPLDHFILDKLESLELVPAPAADREVWIRRVYFDLIGLPPTPQQIDEFVYDRAADAHEKVVDELLASPHFGERWARHWMDLFRYAETCGHEFDYPIPHAWQYRDYLIRTLNADVPYDQFIIEHLAGDLVAEPRRHPETQVNESILGTGFWFLGEATHGPVDVKGDEAGHIDNQIDVMCKSFLGLTVACARCHDHKFDAISTQDYYALSGFLQSSRRQLVMMDSGRTVEKSFKKAVELGKNADKALDELRQTIERSMVEEDQYWEQIPRYVRAAIEVLQSDRSWLKPEQILIEAESLQPVGFDGGSVQQQAIGNRGEFKWSGGKQLWWIDGSVGDVLRLEIDVPVAGSYQVLADFTTAHDYGKIQVSLNGRPIGDEIDLYSKEVVKTGVQDFRQHHLPTGKNSIELQITGKNNAAEPRHMVGVDYFKLVSAGSVDADRRRNQLVAEQVKQFNLNRDILERWIAAIIDERTENTDHPFYVLRMAARSEMDLNTDAGEPFFAGIHDQLGEQVQAANAWKKESVEFASFNDQSLDGWFETGFAFGRGQRTQALHFDGYSHSGPLASNGTAHSGLNGKRLYGVIRSPTFEITHPFVHYRIRGNDIQVRLIVDGYVLDLNNPLLFHDFSFKFSSPDHFAWRSQRGDLKNYLGHRAHIEIIDHGHGHAEVDEIWFSNHSEVKPTPSLTAWTTSDIQNEPRGYHLSRETRTWTELTPLERLAQRISLAFQQPKSLPLENHILQHRLLPEPLINDAMSRLDQLGEQMIANDRQTPRPKLAIGIADGTPENEFVFIRGNHRNLGPEAIRRPIAALIDEQWNLNQQSSGRLELANNIASANNPLTARVAVNRIWHHLTGRGIVSSVDNFGVLGERPTHPRLLDYLATEFIDDGWSLKRMIRRIVLSQTYRMSSRIDPVAKEIDPNNQWLHRFRVRRLQGEVIRDAMLQISGRLDTKMYGPGTSIHLTPFMDGRGRPGKSGPLDGDGRRSVYVEVRRNFLSPMMLAFDTPVPFNAIGRRTVSNVPAQALILMNDPFVVEQAKLWANTHVQKKAGSLDDQIESLYRTGIGRKPDLSELAAAKDFLQLQAQELGIDKRAIVSNPKLWADFCHVIFNMKEFIFVK